MRIATFLGFTVLLTFTSAAFAGKENIDQDLRSRAVQYCTADAVRLCPLTLFDEEQTTACMETHRAELSDACRAVMNAGEKSLR